MYVLFKILLHGSTHENYTLFYQAFFIVRCRGKIYIFRKTKDYLKKCSLELYSNLTQADETCHRQGLLEKR